MMSDLLPYVYPVPDRHGKIRYRFRRKGWKSAYVHGAPGSAEFHREYAEIVDLGPLERVRPQSPAKAAPDSLDDLYRRYKLSPKWKKKAAVTQHTQGLVYERFLNRVGKSGKRYGDRPVAGVTVGWLDTIFGGMVDTPGAANDLRKKLRVLMEYGIALKLIVDNPVRHTTGYEKGKGRHSWTEVEIAQFRARHPLGTMPRLAMELALNTAARRGGVATLTRDNLAKGRIIVAHSKGNNETSVQMFAMTQKALEALPAAPIRHLVTNTRGKPYSIGGLGNKFRQWCDEAGLPHCAIHGLRKALSRRIAEAGGTDAEGMAFTGHKRAATFAEYRAAANRETLADAVVSNLEERFESGGVQPSPNQGKDDAF